MFDILIVNSLLQDAAMVKLESPWRYGIESARLARRNDAGIASLLRLD